MRKDSPSYGGESIHTVVIELTLYPLSFLPSSNQSPQGLRFGVSFYPKFKAMTETYDLPSHWASYMINGDATSFSLNDDGGDAEIAVIDEFMEDFGEGVIVTCSEEPFFSKYHDAQPYGIKACDCLEFTFYLYEKRS